MDKQVSSSRLSDTAHNNERVSDENHLTGSLINTFFRDGDTLIGKLQMYLLRIMLITPVKAIAPLCTSYWIWRFINPRTSRTRLPFLRSALRSWAALEVVFHLFYCYKRRELESHKARPPPLPAGKALQLWFRCVAAIRDVQAGGSLGRIIPTISSQNMLSLATSTIDVYPAADSKADIDGNMENVLRKWDNEPSNVADNMEHLLREWDAKSDGAASEESWYSTGPCDHPSSSQLSLSAKGIELLDEHQQLALARAESCGWFRDRTTLNRLPASRIGELQRGNLEEFIAWAFFMCEDPAAVPLSKREEFEKVVQGAVDLVQHPVKPGYNKNLVSMRLTCDPIPSEHRPLVSYLVTGVILPKISAIFIERGLGFQRYSSGSLRYWYLPAHDTSGRDELPLVFCHGVGVGVTPYLNFVAELVRCSEGRRAVFLVSLPHIAMRIQEDVPSNTQMVGAIADMLTAWGISAAHFVGHSFGTLVVAWMIRLAPLYVERATFIDPVCFLLIKPDVCYNFMYRKPHQPMHLLFQYFLSHELYIANTFSRHFFWSQNVLWPEEVTMPSLVVLSGKDSIGPAHSVRRFLEAYNMRRTESQLKVLWFPNLGHAELNFGQAGVQATQKIIHQILALEVTKGDK